MPTGWFMDMRPALTKSSICLSSQSAFGRFSAPMKSIRFLSSDCLGGETTVVPIEDARHDVFLSLAEPRERGYATGYAWLKQHRLPRVVTLV